MRDGCRCYRCDAKKPLEAFTQRVDDRHYSMCRSCVSEILLTRGDQRKVRLPHTELERICYLCRRTLENARFTRRSNGTYFSACKDCNRHVFAQRRRVRMRAVGGCYTVDQWQALLALYQRCPMCTRKWADIPLPTSGATIITADHIVPISKGGTNSIENIQPLCYSCNSKKGAKTAAFPGATNSA
jgi:5-methylcytosine-specific restriction endonuclease McrA